MKKNLKCIFALALGVASLSLSAQPAMPELGYRWVVNGATSDEFNDTQLDESKWYNADPNVWRGRAPGLFEAEAVSMADGSLRFTVDLLDKPVTLNGDKFTHRGAHVYSKGFLEPGAYAECHMKANKTFMSSTFWLITAGSRDGCDRRTTELDIQECVGYPYNHNSTQRMSSNTHSRSIPSGCNFPEGSVGDHCNIGGKAYDDFHTYAAWWKSPTEILFYLDGKYQYTVFPKAAFDIPMVVKLVSETYDWNEPPNDGGMTGSVAERTTSYDWVRCYDMLPIDEAQSPKEAAYNQILEERIAFTEQPNSLDSEELTFAIHYAAQSDSELLLQLQDADGKVAAENSVKAYAGIGHLPVTIDSDKLLTGSYTVVATLNGEECSYLLKVNGIDPLEIKIAF